MKNLRDIINELLVSKKVEDNSSFLCACIPELVPMIGFDQKHPYHHLDVWEHTMLALECLESNDLETNMALLFHDSGKPFSYQEGEVRHFKGHAEKSLEIAKHVLTRLEYDDDFIENVCYLIETHDMPIDPNELDNNYEMIEKRLQIQYADAKAHHPSIVGKRLSMLDNTKKELEDIREKQRKRTLN